MKRDVLLWFVSGAVSLVFHIGLSTLLEVSVDPDPVDMQDVPKARLEMTAYDVRSSELREDQVAGEKVAPSQEKQAALSQDTIPRVVATQQELPAANAAAARVESETVKPTSAPSDAAAVKTSTPQSPLLSTTRPETSAVAAARPQAARITGGNVFSQPAIQSAPPAAAIAVLGAPENSIINAAQLVGTVLNNASQKAVVIQSRKTAGQTVTDAEPEQTVVTPAPSTAPILVASLATGLQADAQRPAAATLASGNLPAVIAETQLAPSQPALENETGNLAQDLPPQAPPAEFATASLAWVGGTKASFDPASLAAIQSFMTEGDLSDAASNAGSVRDGIAEMLSQVPCSRLQVAFVPETGSLELRGHVPEEGLRLPVLAALQAQMGASIPVVDNLLILPRPQCGALSGIGSVGLPQSTDQLTNPLLVGADAHAKLYEYSEGDRLTFDLTAPDYDAYVYVDYFDANGMVIHLVPNDTVTLESRVAKSNVSIGIDRVDGNFLAVTIGPPYGQEIAVAFAASEPLYDGVRPTVEPADAYLDWLRERVTRARAANADFKGEWVYFFVSTSRGG